jgi:hypothetical protein
MANDFSTRIAVIRVNSQQLAMFLAENIPDPKPQFPIANYIMKDGMKFKQADTRCTFIKVT